MSTGVFCATCRRYIDMPTQPIDVQWRCKCIRPVPSDGRKHKFVELQTGRCCCGTLEFSSIHRAGF